MSTRQDEDALSCSRLKFTTPQQLLDDLIDQGIDPAGWKVCQFLVSDVREIELQIESDPTAGDKGHCGISAPDGLSYPKKKAQQLAKKTRILTQEEIDKLSQPRSAS